MGVIHLVDLGRSLVFPAPLVTRGHRDEAVKQAGVHVGFRSRQDVAGVKDLDVRVVPRPQGIARFLGPYGSTGHRQRASCHARGRCFHETAPGQFQPIIGHVSLPCVIVRYCANVMQSCAPCPASNSDPGPVPDEAVSGQDPQCGKMAASLESPYHVNRLRGS